MIQATWSYPYAYAVHHRAASLRPVASPGFQGSKPTAPAALWVDFQRLLAQPQYREKGRTLLLPETLEKLPSTLQAPLGKVLPYLTPDKIQAVKEKKQLGIAEEISDILYFITLQATIQSGLLSDKRTQGFYNNVRDLMAAHRPDAYTAMAAIADRTVRDLDVRPVQAYFPGSWNPQRTQQMKDFLKMLLLDHAIGLQVGRKGWNVRDPKAIALRMQEEWEELTEQLRRDGTPQSALPEVSFALPDRAAFRKTVEQLLKLGKDKGIPRFSLDSLLRFAQWKSAARTEMMFQNPHMRYEQELKPIAKAWEKLLEVGTFFGPTPSSAKTFLGIA